jgi:mRNA-degrading endonuclease RelE of RelBE toxin-antitoxin system
MDAYQIEWKESALREIKRLDRKADPRTPEDLSRYFRQDLLKQVEAQYAQG